MSSSLIGNAAEGAAKAVAQYQGLAPGAVDALGKTAQVAGVVAAGSIQAAPSLVSTGCTLGALIGGALGGPAAPITALMGAGTGAVIGTIIAAATGKFGD
ncbi:MAG: hypothetical protein KR126chlam2_00138 [Chlamydiae bacterium]|nr:hypothetical protein [Chlamydiota bacterium]